MALTRIEHMMERLLDAFTGAASPAPEADGYPIVAHRGDHASEGIYENSLDAFERSLHAGVWGIEFDVRWSKDRCPVVFHDATFFRLFGAVDALGDLSLKRIRDRFPSVPMLEEVVARFGGRMHLMIELKEKTDRKMREPFLRALASLAPGRDFHLLALDPQLFEGFEAFQRKSFLPVARINVQRMSRMALRRGYAGIAGHHLLISTRRRRVHERAGQGVGTGFIDSVAVLRREMRRGVRWIFSNQAARLQGICEQWTNRETVAR